MLILQSASPRRKELLHKITDDFRVESVPANECVIPSRPAATVMKNAREKALAIKPENGQTVVGADTVVYLAGRFFLKPKNAEEAFEMLKRCRESGIRFTRAYVWRQTAKSFAFTTSPLLS